MDSNKLMLLKQQTSFSPGSVCEEPNSGSSVASPTRKRKSKPYMSAFYETLFKSDKWIATTFNGKLPERRSNMASYVDPYTHRLYVFGGHDLKEGMYNSLWRISLEDV